MKEKKPTKPKIVKNRKVVPLHKREPSVQNLLRHALTENRFKRVVIISEDFEGGVYAGWSKMAQTDLLFFAEYLKSRVIKDLYQ